MPDLNERTEHQQEASESDSEGASMEERVERLWHKVVSKNAKKGSNPLRNGAYKDILNGIEEIVNPKKNASQAVLEPENSPGYDSTSEVQETPVIETEEAISPVHILDDHPPMEQPSNVEASVSKQIIAFSPTYILDDHPPVEVYFSFAERPSSESNGISSQSYVVDDHPSIERPSTPTSPSLEAQKAESLKSRYLHPEEVEPTTPASPPVHNASYDALVQVEEDSSRSSLVMGSALGLLFLFFIIRWLVRGSESTHIEDSDDEFHF